MSPVTGLTVLVFAAAASHCLTVDPDQTIWAIRGHNVTLSCHPNASVDLSSYAVDWRRDDRAVVHTFPHGNYPPDQADQYRNRTILNKDELRRGNVTLLLISVQPPDAGRYRCWIPKLKISCLIDLHVEEQKNETRDDDESTTRPPTTKLPEPPDGAETKSDRNHIIIIIIIPAAAVIFIAVVVVVLLRRGKFGKLKLMFGGRTEREETTPNDPAGTNLTAGDAGGDAESPV